MKHRIQVWISLCDFSQLLFFGKIPGHPKRVATYSIPSVYFVPTESLKEARLLCVGKSPSSLARQNNPSCLMPRWTLERVRRETHLHRSDLLLFRVECRLGNVRVLRFISHVDNFGLQLHYWYE